jgi:hypothetical protein
MKTSDQIIIEELKRIVLMQANKLREQIIGGKTEREIQDGWEPVLFQKNIWMKYLLYK